jgi:methionyl aminopeptidase
MFVLLNPTIGNINLMAVTIKTAEEIEKMRIAGKLASQVLDMIKPHVVPGVTTNTLNDICHDYIVNELGSIPAPLNYGNPPFPKSICTSINTQICHGIPSDKKLKKGDTMNIDVTIIKDGYHGDTSRMYHIGDVAPPAARLSHIAQVAMYIGIDMVKPGVRLGDIGHAIQTYAEANHTSVVREYCGHGIGAVFHEEPQVLHYGKPNTGMVLKPGMTFTIEPMINLGKRETRLLGDHWTVVTKDRSLSAQWEHTILVTETGYEILTLREEEANWKSLLP